MQGDRSTTPAESSFQPSTNHWSLRLGMFKERVTKKQLQQALLDSKPIIQGRMCEWKSRHLGAGIYEMWAEEQP